jgi:hypothetical protein
MPSLQDGLDVVHSFVEEKRARDRAANEDEDVNRKKMGGSKRIQNSSKSAPKHDPPTKSFKLNKEVAKNCGTNTKKTRPPPKNSRKDMALSAHTSDGTGAPVRRNRPKNWRKLRPDKPPPKKKKEGEE